MKIASDALKNLLATNRNLIFADCWTFTCKSGSILRYTTWDTDLIIDGNVFASHDVIIVNGSLKQTRGLEVNQTDLIMYPNLGATPSVVNISAGVVAVYGGLMSLASTSDGSPAQIPFLQAARSGIFDRAKAERFRIFMSTPGDTSLGAVRIFLGEVNGIEVTRTQAKFTCKDGTDILNIQMPRRQYQATCPWTFGDSDCAFNKTSLSESSAVNAGSASTQILCGLTDTAGKFNYGTVKMTSGQNSGLARSVKSYQPGQITLTGAFPNAIATGDTFTIIPGCSKNYAGQTQPFNGSTASGIGSTPNTVYSTMTNTAGFFNGGTIQFTTGANVGQIRTVVSSFPPSTGFPWSTINVSSPFPNSPALGDEFVATSAAANNVATCTGYANTANFGGQPFVPIPETAY